MRSALIAGLVVAACSGPQLTIDRAPRVAQAPSPSAYRCGDPLQDQSTSGTERVSTWNPCWDLEEEIAVRERGVAAAERYGANLEHEQAAQLVQAELVHCKGIPEHELAHSPFAHRRAIREVIPHRSGGEIRGVRIVFEDIPGLTADYLRSAIACQRARYETLGRPPQYLPEDPTLFDGAEVTVSERQNGFEVLISADDPAVGRLALDRARSLVRERTATR